MNSCKGHWCSGCCRSSGSRSRQSPGRRRRQLKAGRERRAQLTPEQFDITRRKGTERAFTGEYWNTHEHGVYLLPAADASGIPEGVESVLTQLGVLPFDEGGLPPEDPSTF